MDAVSLDPTVIFTGEHAHKPPPHARALRAALRTQTRLMQRRERFADVMPAPPQQGEQWHLVSDRAFDFATILETLAAWTRPADVMLSTWTAGPDSTKTLLRLLDDGTIARAAVLVGRSLKRRRPVVFAELAHGLESRAQRFATAEVHAKLLLASGAGLHLVVEGSGNFTRNDRTELYVISHNRPLYDFHAAWMEDLFHGPTST